MHMLRCLMFTLSVLIAVPAGADDIRCETVHFAGSSSGSTIKSGVKGYQSVDYVVGVTAGQKMSVQLDSRNSSLYFNVVAPEADATMAVIRYRANNAAPQKRPRMRTIKI